MEDAKKPYFENKRTIRLQHKLINDHFQNYKPYATPTEAILRALCAQEGVEKREIKCTVVTLRRGK